MWRLMATLAALMLLAPMALADPAKIAAAVETEPAFTQLGTQCPADYAGSGAPATRDTKTNHLECEGIEGICLAQCLFNKAGACQGLAYTLQALKNPDYEKAYELLFAYACRLGNPSGCTNRGAGMMHTRRLTADWDDATRVACTFRSFSWSCEANDAWGCTILGLHHLSGQGTPQDDEAAVAAVRKACDLDPTDAFAACAQGKALLQSRGVTLN